MKLFYLFAALVISAPTFSQSWQQQANAPIGRHHPISFSLEGKGYAVTGTTSNNQPTKAFYEYDPILDAWSTLTPFPGTARSFGIGTVVNGKAYLGFGATNTQYLNDMWSYDAVSGQWTQLASCACTGRRHPAFIGIGNRIYVGLGDDASGNLKDWWMYKIDANTWTKVADLPGPPRHHPFQFNAGGELFAGLGHNANSIYKDWYKLDTATNTWTAMNQFPGEARVAGTQFSHAGFGYVLSGDGDNHSFMSTGEMWRYSPTTDIWTQFPPHPGVSRWAPGSFVINDEVYFFGGRNRQNNQYPTDLWKFDIAAATISIEENDASKLIAYPNPAKNFIAWELNKNLSQIVILNSVGQPIASNDGTTNRMDVTGLSNGFYFVQFYVNGELAKTEKVMVQN